MHLRGNLKPWSDGHIYTDISDNTVPMWILSTLSALNSIDKITNVTYYLGWIVPAMHIGHCYILLMNYEKALNMSGA